MSKKRSRIVAAVVAGIMMGLMVMPAYAAASENLLNYSNLKDEETQKSVTSQMEEAGIPKANLDAFKKYVNIYNKDFKEITLGNNGFTPSKNQQPGYDEEKAGDIWLKDKGPNKADINCRITAFMLYKDMIKADKKFTGNINNLGIDLDTIETYPVSEYTKKDVEKFNSLYGEMPFKYTSDTKAYPEAIRKAWKNREVSFEKNSKATMINVFMQYKGDSEMFVGHTGVLIKEKGGYLFVEKYGPMLPFQATKLKTKGELVRYLVDKLDMDSELVKMQTIIMENDQVLSEDILKQEIRKVSVKPGVLGKVNTKINYKLAKNADVTLGIYNSKNKLVAKKAYKDVTHYKVKTYSWNGKATKGNNAKIKAGQLVGPGKYYCKITSGGKTIKTQTFRFVK